MKILERGGIAAAAMIERLHNAQQRITSLEVSPDSLWVCREEEALASLLEWSSVDTALRPFVEARASTSAPSPDDELTPRRHPVFALTPDSEQRAPSSAAWPQERPVKTVTAVATRESTQRITRILTEVEADAREFMRSDAVVQNSPRHERVRSAQQRVVLSSVVTQEDAARWLQSSFASDDRLLRAWDQVVARTPASPEVTKILTEPGSRRVILTEAPPTDPIRVRLQPAVDRALRKSLAKTMVDSPGSGMLPGVTTSRETILPQWDSSSSSEETRRSFGEPQRTSSLRRLASYGETIEPERLLVKPTPSTVVPQEAPPRRPCPTFERADIAQEVADIFRREALRHGIVPEEEMP